MQNTTVQRRLEPDFVKPYVSRFGPLVESYQDHFDFTLLFEDTILSAVPSALFLIAAVARLWQLWPQHPRLQAKGLKYSKLTILVAYASLQLALLAGLGVQRRLVSWSALLSSGLSLVNAVLFCILSPLEHARSIRPSSTLLVYLCFSAACDGLRLRTLWRMLPSTTVAVMAAVSLALKLVILAFESLEKARFLPSHYRQNRPEETSSILNRGGFFWLNPLLWAGARGLLGSDNMFQLDPLLSTQGLSNQFIHAWQDTRLKKQSHGVLRALVTVLRWGILRAMVPRAMLLSLTILQPIMLQRLLRHLEEPEGTQHTTIGRGLIAAYSLTYFGMAITRGFYEHILYRLVTALRGCLVSALQWHTGRLDAQSIQDPKMALTLMSSDIEAIINGLKDVHEMWANSIQIIVATYLLSTQLGSAAAAPVVLCCLAVGGSVYISRSSSKRQRAWMTAVEERVSLISSIILVMKEAKMKGLIGILTDLIQKLRTHELHQAAKFRFLIVSSVAFAFTPELLCPAAAFLVFYFRALGTNEPFDSTRAFTSLSLMIVLSQPLNQILQGLPRFAGAFGSTKRIQNFLQAEEQKDFRDRVRDDDTLQASILESSPEVTDDIPLTVLSSRQGQSRPTPDTAIRILNGEFGWKAEKSVLQDINLSIPTAKLTCIIGPVASGKSTLCKVLLGEARAIKGKVDIMLPVSGISFCGQTAFLTNNSIKNNIIGFGIFERSWYDQVILACALTDDISSLSKGDATLIGTGGVNLSGGQRHKVALARALYSRNPIMILDDIFSGLDANSAEHCFHHAIGPQGLARKFDATVVFATHAVKFLPSVDHVIVLDTGGKVAAEGPFQKLLEESAYVRDFHLGGRSQSSPLLPSDEDREGAALEPAESAEVGAVLEGGTVGQLDPARQTGDITVYRYYFGAAGLSATLGLIAFGMALSVLINFPTIWLKRWTEASAMDVRAGQDPLYISTYAAIQAAAVCFMAGMCYHALMTIPTRAGNELHNRILLTLMNAPLSEFSKTDVGILTNRFSQDINLIDEQVAFSLLNIAFLVFQVIGQAVIVGVSSPWTAVTYPIVGVTLYFIQSFYLRTSRQLRFLDIEAKSPLYTHFLETIEGLTTIRAFNWVQDNLGVGTTLLDESQRPAYLLYMIQRWLTFVLEMLISCLAAIVATLAVTQSSSAGLTGVALFQVMAVNKSLQYTILVWTELETSIGAVSRMKSFNEHTPNEHKAIENNQPPPEWPMHGRVEFRNLSAAYDVMKDDEPALKSMNLIIAPGEKIGICGRSGSGKSSTVLALMRMLEITSGAILIDDIDLSTAPRNVVRTIFNPLPQHAFFMRGSIRLNLDPTNSYTNAELINALNKVNLGHLVEDTGIVAADDQKSKQAHSLSQNLNPSNLSHGQRQLFALAGALLRRDRKILILDEPTSNVDTNTDAFMQEVIRTDFSHCTIIAVAHRLNTIVDFDRVIVMDHGHIAEVGKPKSLLRQKERSLFRQMWDSDGGSE